jgi:hypothetical protein
VKKSEDVAPAKVADREELAKKQPATPVVEPVKEVPKEPLKDRIAKEEKPPRPAPATDAKNDPEDEDVWGGLPAFLRRK